jgi:hypothetical protein
LNTTKGYIFVNNTTAEVTIHLTDTNTNVTDYTIPPLSSMNMDIFYNLIQVQVDDCSGIQTLAVYDLSSTSVCLAQILDPTKSYSFEAVVPPDTLPVTIILRNNSNIDTILVLTDENSTAPYTNLTSWRPAGCSPPL